MSQIRVKLEDAAVTEGQGIGEGKLELRIQAGDGTHTVVWPALNSSVPLVVGAPPYPIGWEVGRYTVTAGTLSKKFDLAVTEEDGGTLGANDLGSGSITFDLTPDMAPSDKSATINLYQPHMKKSLGQVRIRMAAQRA